jgi:hypothetical protein
LEEPLPVSSAPVIDFIQAHKRLIAQSERSSEESVIEQEVRKAAIQRRQLLASGFLFEDAAYWLISAAVLAYLAIEILSI